MTVKQDLTAIITDKRGRILSIGKNSYIKTHPLQALIAEKLKQPHKIFLHAEIDAIIKCRQLEKAYKIQIFRTNSKGEYLLAAPCSICKEAILTYSPIKIIEHT